jgi:nitrogen regulatory protein PII
MPSLNRGLKETGNGGMVKMKMVIIVYNEAIDAEVMDSLAECAIKNYTKITGVFGRGDKSGTHFGTDIWPGRNNLLYVACDDAGCKKILTSVAQLRKTLASEGLKAFVWELESVT